MHGRERVSYYATFIDQQSACASSADVNA